MIMRHPEESKTAALEEEIAALMRRGIDADGTFSSTALREATLRLAGALSKL